MSFIIDVKVYWNGRSLRISPKEVALAGFVIWRETIEKLLNLIVENILELVSSQGY